MSPQNKKKLPALLLILLLGLIFNYSFRSLQQATITQVEKESDLYIPEPHYLKFISLGHDGLISDILLARALVYYGSHYQQRETFTFKHQKKLFIAALHMDPMNKEAFLMGNNIMSGINIRDSQEILEMGMKYHPEYWKFPEMMGFNYFYHIKDPYLAAQYYEKAAALPNHPPYVPSLSGKLYQESGRHKDAIRVLNNFYTTTRDPRLKKNFENTIEAIKEKIRLKRFRLRGNVTHVHDAVTFTFRPDLKNPQFRYLKQQETMRVVGLKPYQIESPQLKERLFAHFQQEYAQLLLKDKDVQVEFQREQNGQLSRDGSGRLKGSLFLKNNRLYQEFMVETGMMEVNYKLPFSASFRQLLKEAEAKGKEKGRGIHTFPPHEAPLKEIFQYVARVIAVRVPINRVESDPETGNIYLHADADYRNRFSAVITPDYVKNFSALGGRTYLLSLAEKWIKVTGFAGMNKKRVEMKLYFPEQLELSSQNPN